MELTNNSSHDVSGLADESTAVFYEDVESVSGYFCFGIDESYVESSVIIDSGEAETSSEQGISDEPADLGDTIDVEDSSESQGFEHSTYKKRELSPEERFFIYGANDLANAIQTYLNNKFEEIIKVVETDDDLKGKKSKGS